MRATPTLDRAHILAEIRRTANENGGKALGRRQFASATGIRVADWEGIFWARWSDAVTEAGLSPNELQRPYEDEFIVAKLAGVVRDLGTFPTKQELRLAHRADPTFPNDKTIYRRGSARALAALVAEWSAGRPGYERVTESLTPLLRAGEESQPSESRSPEPEFGFVYLLRSRRHYKLGRTNAAGRRERELAIQLPERVQTIHRIKTDDPIGIERYWHLRFADRRRNGEWFELTPADVQAFKRRKFM